MYVPDAVLGLRAVELRTVHTRVENANNQAAAYVYALDAASDSYALTGVHRGRLVLSVPFDIDIDLAEVYQM